MYNILIYFYGYMYTGDNCDGAVTPQNMGNLVNLMPSHQFERSGACKKLFAKTKTRNDAAKNITMSC